MVWGLIGLAVAYKLFGPAKKNSEPTKSYTSSTISNYNDAQLKADAMLKKWQDKPAYVPPIHAEAQPVRRKVYLTARQISLVRYAVDSVNRTEEWFTKFFLSLVNAEVDSPMPYQVEIEAAIQILQESEGDAQQIELLQTSLVSMNKLWHDCREARRQHEEDKVLLGPKFNIFGIYVDKGTQATLDFIETMPEELQDTAKRVLEFCQFVYPR